MFSLLLLFACGSKDSSKVPEDSATEPAPLDDAVLDAIDLYRIQANVDLLASDDLGGRTPGSIGHAVARAHIAAELADIGLTPVGEDGAYTLPFPLELSQRRYGLDEDGAVLQIEATEGVNIAGLLPGADPDRAHETVVVMAHYDHLGVTEEGAVYNGAYDDGTGVATLLELARVFVEQGVTFDRSILFLITDGEEGGLNGAYAWTADPTLSLEDVAVAFSVDPLGRALLPDYWPLILLGLERCPELQDRVRSLARHADMDVAFVNRGPIPVFASDQDPFYELDVPVPAFWFVSPGMTWYHTTDDDPETIDYRSVRDHARFLAGLLAAFANDEARYEDQDEQELSVQDAADAAALLEGVLGSGELTDDERGELERLKAEFDEAVSTGVAGDDLQGTYLSAAVLLLLELTEAHPGEVPPPWPEE